MHSLFDVLVGQHREEFAPVRCNKQTASRLVRYFEDIVIENKISALIVEGRCLNGDRAREVGRLAKLVASSRRTQRRAAIFSGLGKLDGNCNCTGNYGICDRRLP